MAGLRNLLVHLYWEVDDAMIYTNLRSRLGDFETFVNQILHLLASDASPFHSFPSQRL